MENQRSSRLRSFREWARRTRQSTSRPESEQRHGQRHSVFPRDGSSRSGGQANQQNPTQRRQSLAESLRAFRRRPSTWCRQIMQSESALHQAQAEFGSSLDEVEIPVTPNDQPTAAVVGDQSPNQEPVVAASEGRPSNQLSNRIVSEFLRRTRGHVPDSSEERSHNGSESESITTPSILNTGSEWSEDRGYDPGNHPSQSIGSSSSGHASIQGQDGGEELVEIGNLIVRVDAGAQATDWNWNF